jgi:Na+-transporting methylmalonyl-CoA/oxaloacetate decarboxylase gamma subunit
MDTIIGILMDWHVAIVLLVLLFLFPLIFFLSSMDRSPVRVRRVQVKKMKPAKQRIQKPAVDTQERQRLQEDQERRRRMAERERRSRAEERALTEEPDDRKNNDSEKNRP